jgi:hypothetical protein
VCFYVFVEYGRVDLNERKIKADSNILIASDALAN